MDKEFLIFEDQLKVGESQEIVDGVRIMVTGEFEKIINNFMKDNIDCISYSQAIGKLVVTGISEIIQDIK